MKSISRRIRRLEDRLCPLVDTEFTRRLRERIEARRRRVAQWPEQEGSSVSNQYREHLSGLSVTEVLPWVGEGVSENEHGFENLNNAVLAIL
jgi:hypothetical protein